jgi:hypothetical protein
MAQNKDFIVKNGLVVQAQGSEQSTSTTTGAIVTPGGMGIGGNINIAGGITAGGVNLLAFDDHVIYVSDGTGNDTTGDGRRTQSAYRTIKYALSQAVSGDKVYVEPGTYEEIFPLTVPQGVSLIGAGLRAVTVQPTAGTNTLDCFLMNGESYVSDLTITGFFDPGYAFKFATGAKITTRSPYIERISVITRGSTPTSEDPYGFLSADAGNGAYLDAGVLDPTSLEPAMLWNEVTFIVPNATGWYMTNGARAELLNGFTYFADKSIQAEAGALGYGGVGRTRLKLNGISGVFTASDTITYYSNTGTVLASGVIDEVEDDYIYIQGPSWGFRDFVDANTSTQIIYTTGTWAATATQIVLADYHQFGAELRCIGSAAVFGNQGVLANGTGTDLKLIAFNLSNIGAGGDLSNDYSKTIQANEIVQTNGGKIFYQTVDQNGDFRVGNSFLVNQRTGDVSFGNATVNLTTLTSLTITDGLNSTVINPSDVTVGNLVLAGNSLISNSGNINLDPAGPAIILNSDTRVQGSLTVTNITRLTNTVNATNSTTGALQVDGGVSVDKDIWVEGSINVRTSATIANLYVTDTAFIPGGFTATSFTSTELTVVGAAALQQLTATLTTLTELTVLETLSVGETSNLNDVYATTGTFVTMLVTSVTNAISTTTGAFQVRGGVGIGRDLYVGGSTYLAGDLYVDGAQFTVDSTNIVTGDKLLILSSATTVAAVANNSGIQIGTGTGFVSFLFDGSSAWKSRGSLVPNGTANLGAALNPWNIIYGNSVFDNSNRVITSVTPTAGLGIGILNLTSGGPAASFAVTNTGVLSLIAGTDTAVSSAAGNVTISLTSTLQSVTGRGASTDKAIRITNNTPATSQTTGSLVVTGGVGVGGALYAGNIFSNGSAVWTTATLTDNNQLGNGAGYLTSSTLGLFGVSAINAGVGIAVSRNTGSVTVTNIGVVSLQGSAYIGISANSGSNILLTNLGVQQAVSGSGISVSNATGTVTISSVDTLQLVTARGATTNQPVAFTSTNLSASTSSGQALLVSGGIGALAVYATTVFDSGNRALTSVTPVGGTAISVSAVSTTGPNTTFTINNTGVTAAVGTTYLGVSTSTGSVIFTNLGVQTLTAGTDTAVSGSTGTLTFWTTSTLQSVTNRGATTTNAIRISNTTQSTSTNSGALIVTGGIGVNLDSFFGGNVTITGTLNADVVQGAISTSSNLLGGDTGSIPYQESSGRTAFIGIGAEGSVLQSNGTTATWNTTASIHVGMAQFAQTATNAIGGTVDVVNGKFSGVTTVTNVTASTSTQSGALQVAGGVGVGKELYAREIYDNNSRVITSVTPSAGTAIGISNLVSGGPSSSFTIENLGVTQAVGTTYLGISTSTGSVIFTNLGVQTISGTSYLGASAGTGTVILTNLGVQTLTAGTDTSVSQSTGTVTVWNTSTLQSVTGRGASTNQAISISNTGSSNTTTSGALTISGGVGIGENLNVGGTLNVRGRTTFSDTVTFNGTATFVLSTNTIYTDNILELHTNPAGIGTKWAFDDGKDIGLRIHYYNRTLNTGTDAALVLASDTQWLEWYNAGAEGTSTFVGASYGSFKTGNILLVGTSNSSNTTTGALVVTGGVGVGGNLNVGGTIVSNGSAVITAATLGEYGVSQIIAGQAIAVSPSSGTGTVTISNLGVRSITASSGIQVSTSTGTVIIQSVDTLQLVTDRGFTTSNRIHISNSVQSTSGVTGALRVSGGVGIERDLFVSGGINVGSSSTFTGLITGYITTASNILGGTAGSLVYQAASGNTQFIGAGVVGSLLQSQGAAVAPGYVSTQSLQVGFSIRAVTATNISLGTAGQLPYQTSVGQTAFVGGTGSQGNVLVSNGTGAPTFNNTLTLAGTTQATSTLTGALQVRGGVGIGGDLWIGGTGYFAGSQVVTAANLGQFGVAQIVAGEAIGVTPTSGTGTVTLSNLGVRSLTTTTFGGIAISTSTGSVIIQSIDTLQLVTQRGNTTNQVINITATNLSSSTSTGQALLVSGGVGALAVYASNLFDAGSRVVTSIFPSGGTGISITNVSTSNANVSFQINNTGVTSAVGTPFLGVSAATGAVTFTNLGVQSITAGTGTFVSASTGQITISSIDSLQSVTDRGFTTSNRINIINNTSATTTTNGALTVAGGIGVLGDIYARNIYTNGQIVGGQTSTSTNLAGGAAGSIPMQYAPSVTGFIGIGPVGSILFSNGTTATWTASSALLAGVAVTATNLSGGLAGWIPIQSANSQTSFISSGTAGQLLQMGTNTATWVSTSTLQVFQATYATTATEIAGGTAGQILYQTGVGQTDFVALGIAGELLVSGGSGTPRFQNTLTLASTVNATSTSTGALQVRGGVGIGRDLWVGGVLYATVQGTINTASNIALGSAGSIVYQVASGQTGFIPIGANGSLLQSNGTTATYVATATLRIGFADVASASGNLSGGVGGSIPYQAATGVTNFIGIGSNGTLLRSNGSTATWVTTATLLVGDALRSSTSTHIAGGTQGSLPIQTAAGRTGFVAIGAAGTILQSNGTTAQWFSTGTLLAGTAQNINGGTVGAIPFQESTGVTRFISPGVVGSILQMGATTATFINSASISVGFATRASSSTFTADVVGGAAGQLLYQISVSDTGFINTGTEGSVLVSRPGAPTYQNTLTLAGTTQATSTLTGALQVRGGVGIGGNLYVGGTLFATVSGSINTASNIAAGSAGAILYQTGAGITGFLNAGVAGTIIQSNGTNPSYVSTTTLLVGDSLRAQSVNNLTGGLTGSIPYQITANTTRYIGIGPNGSLLQSNGSTATWVSTGSLIAGTALSAINIAGGAANRIPYQTSTSTTAFSANLTFNGTSLTVGGAVTAAQFIPNNVTVPTSGMYGASNQVGIATNSTSRVFITSTGYVGINQTVPTATLDVNGGFKVSGVFTSTNAITATSALLAGTVIGGGVAVAQNVWIGGNYQAVSSSTGALRVTGGIGATGNIWAREIYADSIDVRANAVIMATAFS